MVWRDLDVSVLTPGLTAEQALRLPTPLLSRPDITSARYLNQTGRFTPEGKPRNARFFFMVFYEPEGGHAWKVDISFWLDDSRDEEACTRRLCERVDDDTRLTILWLKDRAFQTPHYRVSVHSTDIYDAVLEHGVRTPEALDAYLVERGKPALGT